MEADKAFGIVLRQLRKERGLSQERLAFEADLNRQFVSLLELGERSPSLVSIYKLGSGLGLSGSELLQRLELHLRAAHKKHRRQI